MTVGEVVRTHLEMSEQWPLIIGLEWRWGAQVLCEQEVAVLVEALPTLRFQHPSPDCVAQRPLMGFCKDVLKR